MWKSKRGQVWSYAIMLGLVIIVLALALAPTGRDFVDTAMNESVGEVLGMNCTSTTISTFQQGACVITDFSLFYFFGGLILIGGAVAVARILL